MFEFNLIVIAITYMVVTGESQYYPDNYCQNSEYNLCPKGESFEYPFYRGGYSRNSTDNCGYPEFEINCSFDDGRPMINISHNLYTVLRMDSELLRFLVVDVEVEEEECPRPTHNFTLQTNSLFAVEENHYNVIYFYNCSSGYPENAVQRLPCLDTNTTPGLRSFAFREDDYPRNDGYNWFANCQENVVVPVDSLHNHSNFRQDLKSGLTVRWNRPEECRSCERSGGHCLYNQTDGAPPLCSCQSDTKLYHGACPSKGDKQYA